MPPEVTMPREVTIPREAALAGSVEVLGGLEVGEQLRADHPPPTGSVASRGTGRVRHEDKITVYISRDELVRLEQARLALRAEHGIVVDRGRIVREAVAAALDDMEVRGVESNLFQRLVGS